MAGKAEVARETLVDWYRSMREIRTFEDQVQKLFAKGLVRGSTHLAIGQEAVAVGFMSALSPGDRVLCTYRGHHHCLARGMDAAAAFAEILGRRTGVCGGRGGSMHLTDVTKGLYGSYAIVGAHLPIAVGMAWASHLQGKDDLVAVFFGDGTTTIGAFHEAVNLAAVWKLPVVFVCENNRYSEYTPIDAVSPVVHAAADRAVAYGIPGAVVDGNDVSAVYNSAAEAVERARSGGGPTILEAETYRHGGHSRSDPGKYRPVAEVEEWLARDPIAAVEQKISAFHEDRTMLTSIDEQVDSDMKDALSRALGGSPPDPSTLNHHVFAGDALL